MLKHARVRDVRMKLTVGQLHVLVRIIQFHQKEISVETLKPPLDPPLPSENKQPFYLGQQHSVTNFSKWNVGTDHTYQGYNSHFYIWAINGYIFS